MDSDVGLFTSATCLSRLQKVAPSPLQTPKSPPTTPPRIRDLTRQTTRFNTKTTYRHVQVVNISTERPWIPRRPSAAGHHREPRFPSSLKPTPKPRAPHQTLLQAHHRLTEQRQRRKDHPLPHRPRRASKDTIQRSCAGEQAHPKRRVPIKTQPSPLRARPVAAVFRVLFSEVGAWSNRLPKRHHKRAKDWMRRVARRASCDRQPGDLPHRRDRQAFQSHGRCHHRGPTMTMRF